MCAKCGSTSIFRALHKSIIGRPKRPVKPWVQNFAAWRAPGVEISCTPGDVHVHVVREPIERYVSAFHSKLKCCPGASGRQRGCYKDHQNVQRARALLALGGNATSARCLHMDDFAGALRAVHRLGKQAELDEHFLPQHLRCRVQPNALDLADPKLQGADQLRRAIAQYSARGKRLRIRGNVSQLALPLTLLQGFAFKGGRLAVTRSHRTPRDDAAYQVTKKSWRALCEVSYDEYMALGLRQPAHCPPT